MSLLGSLATTTSEILFGPPDIPPKKVPAPPPTQHKPLPPPDFKPNMAPSTKNKNKSDTEFKSLGSGCRPLTDKTNRMIPNRESSKPRQGRGHKSSSTSSSTAPPASASSSKPPTSSETPNSVTQPPTAESSHAATSLSETLFSSGASVLSALGSLVASSGPGLGIAAPTTTKAEKQPKVDEDNDKTPTASRVVSSSSYTAIPADGQTRDALSKEEHSCESSSLTGSVLASVSDFLWDRATSAKEAAFETASTLSSTAVDAVFPRLSSQDSDKSSPELPPAYQQKRLDSATPPSRSSSTSSSTLSYIPPQYDSTGKPFSEDPAVAAMQRIPDYPCLHNNQNSAQVANRQFHCCIPPSHSESDLLLHKQVSRSSTTTDSLTSLTDCNCDCFKTVRRDSISSCVASSSNSSTTSIDTPHNNNINNIKNNNNINNAEGFSDTINPLKSSMLQDAQEDACSCTCHDQHRYQRGKSGHFHRVEQLVKGTKRVVRDIKNVM